MVLGMSALHAEPTYAPARGPGLPAAEPLDAVPTACTACGVPASALRPLHGVTGRCPGCEEYARDRWYAGRYASEARPGQVVDEGAVAAFAYLLPRAFARKGLLLARRGVEWVVERAPRAEGSDR